MERQCKERPGVEGSVGGRLGTSGDDSTLQTDPVREVTRGSMETMRGAVVAR